jgi:hypothetical protein
MVHTKDTKDITHFKADYVLLRCGTLGSGRLYQEVIAYYTMNE